LDTHGGAFAQITKIRAREEGSKSKMAMEETEPWITEDQHAGKAATSEDQHGLSFLLELIGKLRQ
jgi:hypothetical protein